MDRPWVNAFEDTPGAQMSAADVSETVGQSFEGSMLEPGVADSLKLRLQDEMFMEHGMTPRTTLDLPAPPEELPVPEVEFPGEFGPEVSEPGEMEGFLSDRRRGVPPVSEGDLTEQAMRNWQSQQGAMEDLIDLFWSSKKK
jgi:hypothetical protein